MSRTTTSGIDKVRADLPPLERALRLQDSAADAGLAWPEAADIWSKINEELAEAKAASEDRSVLGARIAVRAAKKTDKDSAGEDCDHLCYELGDLLFAVVDVCRLLGVDPIKALSHANERFVDSYHKVEERINAEEGAPGNPNSASIKLLWEESKRSQGRGAG